MKQITKIGRILFSGIILFVAGCSQAATADTQKIKIMLDWLPNTNHTGLYVAIENGYFKNQGLDVEIIQPTDSPTEQLVASNQAQFGISYQEQLTYALTAKNPMPIKAIATILQHNTSGFASATSANINSPKDFAGKKYGAFGSPSEKATLRGVMQAEGANADEVKMIQVDTGDFFTLVPNQVDFAWIFEGWTGIEAELRGMDLNFISLREVDATFDYYTPVIIGNNDFMKKNPDVTRKLMSAITEGYAFSIDNPDEAAAIFSKHVPEANPELVKASQLFLSNKYIDDAPYFGYMEESRWGRFADWLYENDLLENKLDVKEAFTNEYLPQ